MAAAICAAGESSASTAAGQSWAPSHDAADAVELLALLAGWEPNSSITQARSESMLSQQHSGTLSDGCATHRLRVASGHACTVERYMGAWKTA